MERAVRRALGTDDSAAAFGVRGTVPVFLAAPMSLADEASVLGASPWHGAPLLSAGGDAPVPTRDEPSVPGAVAQPATSLADAGPDLDVPALWQLRRTWIAFEREGALVLIDQHSAHERVLFERFMNEMTRGGVPSQQLLFPLTLHLSPAEADACEESRGVLQQLGFEIDAFGAQSVLVRAVPAPHPRFDAERCLRETLASLAGDRGPSVLPRHERLAATVACKAAIKAGEAMALPEMRALFLALARSALPAHDVHGRSTIVQISWDELERRFGRR